MELEELGEPHSRDEVFPVDDDLRDADVDWVDAYEY